MTTQRFAIYDFDGTIFRGDSFIKFSIFSLGWFRALIKSIRAFPYLMGYALGFCSNNKAKESLFSALFSSMDYRKYCQNGARFSAIIEKYSIRQTIESIRSHRSEGYEIIIASASCYEWIKPWATTYGITHVVATQPQVKTGLLTGHFETPNCFGQEKILRLKASFPEISNSYVEVFTDSKKKDAPLISLSCKHHIIKS